MNRVTCHTCGKDTFDAEPNGYDEGEQLYICCDCIRDSQVSDMIYEEQRLEAAKNDFVNQHVQQIIENENKFKKSVLKAIIQHEDLTLIWKDRIELRIHLPVSLNIEDKEEYLYIDNILIGTFKTLICNKPEEGLTFSAVFTINKYFGAYHEIKQRILHEVSKNNA